MLVFCGYFNIYLLRTNMSIGIVIMTQNRYTTLDNGTVVNIGPEFEWDNVIQGYILSSFFYGYITTQLLGGLIGNKIGGKLVFGGGIAVTALVTLISPWLAELSVYALLVARILMGVFEVSLLWFAAWVYATSESPQTDPKISPEERDYIEHSLRASQVSKAHKVQWKALFTSGAVWSLNVALFCETWGFYTLLTLLPKYFKDVFQFDISKSGLASALPYISISIMMHVCGQLADRIIAKKWLTLTKTRKTFMCIGFFSQTGFMLGAAFWGQAAGTVFCLAMAVGLGAFAIATVGVNALDIAPLHSGLVFGIANTWGTVPGIISPTIAGYVISTDNPGPEFDWSSELQGYILSSFFYGYISTQFIGGIFASRIGGKTLFGLGVIVTAVLTIITPWLTEVNVYLLIAVRVIEGVFEGVTYPCIHTVWSKWAPPLERARLATFAFSGCFVGTVVAMPSCAYLAEFLGWRSVFYICGASGVVWYIGWVFLVSGAPEDDPRISDEELAYIQESINSTSMQSNSTQVPWKEIFTSMPVWAITVSHFAENWGFYTLLTQLPKYLKDAYNYDLGKSGFLSALPYLVMSILIQFSGQLADWLLEKRLLTTTQVRKVFNCVGFLSQTVFMLIAAFWSNRIASVLCLTLAVGLGSLAWPGFSVNHLDLAPQYASILMGISNTFATIPGIVSPTLTGYIVYTPTTDQWETVFFIAAGIYLFGAVFYGTFASGNLQPWAAKAPEDGRLNKNEVEMVQKKPVSNGRADE
ncbi:hypothetical protein YQE_08281, partial [Dendroctonus ponderosae]